MPDSGPGISPSDAVLRAHVERALDSSYELDREIGRGGMGIVYRAKDRRLKRTVAIKLLPPELAFRTEIKSRFLREAETAAQLNHPNIVPIYSVDERDGLVFFVMTCIEGKTLGRRLHDEGQLGVDETRRILREVADALAYAHGRGVIHRDIKPDNILLDDESGRAMVTDFGIARAVQEGGDSRLTATGMAIGTPAYMSPEQAVGDKVIDGRSDLYSLGVVGYQMLVGEPPFVAGSTPAMLMKQLTERPVPVAHRRRDVPPDLDATVMTLLEKEPERRFANANMLLLALKGDLAAAYPQLRPTDHAGQPALTSFPAGRESPAGGRPLAEYDPRQSPWPPQPVYGGGPAPVYAGGATPGYAGAAGADVASYVPSGDDLSRWMADPVQKFRKKFATYAAVNAVILIAAIFGDSDIIGLTVIWSMFMAANYAKLWTGGYDWRDVFRQPRDRRLADVAHETVEEMRGVFDRSRRGERGGVWRPLRPTPPAAPMAPMAFGAAPRRELASPADYSALGGRANAVRQAESDRDEILRMVDSLPKSDRSLVTQVAPSAEGLFRRVQALAASLVELDRGAAPEAAEQLEAQISQLEAQANPLERTASEDRVRRLALLKRQRRALIDATRRRDEASAKLESCALALGTMRLDLLRLRTGGMARSVDQITLLTERAKSLADDVDAAVYAADEIGKLTGGKR